MRDDDDDDPEAPDPADTDDDRDADGDLLTPCPACRQMMYDDAGRCPHCGHDVERDGSATSHAPWVVVTVFICLVVALVTWVL